MVDTDTEESAPRSPQALAQLFLGTAARVEDAVAKFDLPVACGGRVLVVF